MIHSLLTGIIGMVLIAAGWLAVQRLAHKDKPDTGPDCDYLEGMAHHCGSCDHSDTCGIHHI